jgi:hypothetical protein
MADRGRALVQNWFSIEAMAENNLAVYRMLLSTEEL